MQRQTKFLVMATAAILFMACGGGGGDGGDGVPITPESIEAMEESITITSEVMGETYRISVGLPPTYDESGNPRPAIFLLDGDWFFDDFFDGYDADDNYILVGINNSSRRNIDYLPANTCETEIGRCEAFLDFLVSELVPYLDANYAIDPQRRLLFGHSHGGSFVFYALFRDHGETFPLLFSNDASLQCWNVSLLEEGYRSAYDTLPVIFYASAATEGNADVVGALMNDIAGGNYEELVVRFDVFNGSHDGILNMAGSVGFTWIAAQIED